MHNHNPHTKAAGAYGSTSSATAAATDQRMLEGTILLQAAQKLEIMGKRLESGEKVPLEDLADTVDYNQKLWQLFVDTMKDETHTMPLDVKSNIVSLALFVFKRTHEILCDPTGDKFTVLVSINRNIAAGLMKKVPHAVSQPLAEPPAERLSTDSMA